MTECCYNTPITTFDLQVQPQPVFEVDVIGRGNQALVEVNHDLGLALDEWDLDYYTNLFQNSVKRNPTSVECFGLAQSNSEHCRHWFFRGQLYVDGSKVERSLFGMVKGTQQHSNSNNVIKFSDNSSAIRGYQVAALTPEEVLCPSPFHKLENVERHITCTAETHNFPTSHFLVPQLEPVEGSETTRRLDVERMSLLARRATALEICRFQGISYRGRIQPLSIR